MSAAPLPPLPIPVRPTAGESVNSYINRLARANHLRPSALQTYLRAPGGSMSVSISRLAAISGRTTAALTHALAVQGPRTKANQHGETPPVESQAERKARLFAAIRADAALGIPPSTIAIRHGTGYRIVRQALASPTPPPRKPRVTKSAPTLDPVRGIIDALRLADPALTPAAIWARLLDEHDAEVSYGTVQSYIRRTSPQR
jgi:hypothetical protein